MVLCLSRQGFVLLVFGFSHFSSLHQHFEDLSLFEAKLWRFFVSIRFHSDLEFSATCNVFLIDDTPDPALMFDFQFFVFSHSPCRALFLFTKFCICSTDYTSRQIDHILADVVNC